MSPDDDVARAAFAHYVDELRRGSTDPYIAYRVYEEFWHLDEADRHLVNAAVIRLLESDPWFMTTQVPHEIDRLSIEELERVETFVGAGPAAKYAALLRARLWFYAARGREPLLQRALQYLEQVPDEQRAESWHELVVDCYEVLDFAQYKQAAPKLVALASPARRAPPLASFLRRLAHQRDWVTYDRYRPEWDRLPANRSACECYTNQLYTDDGVRAAAAESWDVIPELLAKAANVRGCPHLNSYGLRLELAKLLVGEKRHLAAVRQYLERAATFEATRADFAQLQRELDEATRERP